MINVNDILGHVELKIFNEFENGRMITYGYSIKYDRNGKEVSRTEPCSGNSTGWDDGSPFTELDKKMLEL